MDSNTVYKQILGKVSLKTKKHVALQSISKRHRSLAPSQPNKSISQKLKLINILYHKVQDPTLNNKTVASKN
jgi:hypothetical protein